MAQLRALKTDEEIASIPLDQPILIELPGGVEVPEVDAGADKGGKPAPKPEADEIAEPDAKKLQEQLEAALAAQKSDRERADRLERDAAESKRLADQRAKEIEEARKRAISLEGDVINGGLTAAQNELAAAKAELVRAGEAGDYGAMGEAQSRIGRASAQILSLESGAAEVAEREKEKPREAQQEQVLQQPRTFEEQVRSNPNLMQSEREWMLRQGEHFKDPDFNRKLESAYAGAMMKGLVRGSQAYFDHIETATGLKTPGADTNEERDISVQAPPSRQERGSDGRPSSNRITLSPEQREIAKSMGVTEIEYAKQVQAFAAAQKADPEKYGNRG